MRKLTGLIAGAALTFGVGAANAGETPEILGAVDYQAMSTVEMSSITGERRRGIKIVNRNTNTNNNTNTATACAAACSVVVVLPPLPPLPLPPLPLP